MFVASLPYQGSCFVKQRVAVSIKLERSWIVVFRFGIGFRNAIGMVRTKYMLKECKHFQWQTNPVDYDAFHMTLYELWLRPS
uniref:Uncharacterized protein n=2 Tax=Ficus carica TaxID=3494 RepID=A0AA88JE68_FICCA|nr:hypothetical protein TIFTF001_055057 [Ficus carica]